MNEFTGVFAQELRDYVQLRAKDMTAESLQITVQTLFGFDLLMVELSVEEKIVSEELVNQWIRKLEAVLARKTVSDRVSVLRRFLRYLSYLGYMVYIPPCPKATDSYIPYIFSNHELNLIFSTADRMDIPYAGRVNTNLAYQMPVYLRLLYGCGLRSGEVADLKVKDICFDSGTLVIRKAKNNKQRIVPMHQTMAALLKRYCLATGIYGFSESYLFADKNGNRISIHAVRDYFVRILKSTGIYIKPEPHTRGQCIHCLRHVFAVRSFSQAESQGRSTTDSVPYLSVYLGHFDMDGTEKYLKFSADMLPNLHHPFETYSADVFPEVDYEA